MRLKRDTRLVGHYLLVFLSDCMYDLLISFLSMSVPWRPHVSPSTPICTYLCLSLIVSDRHDRSTSPISISKIACEKPNHNMLPRHSTMGFCFQTAVTAGQPHGPRHTEKTISTPDQLDPISNMFMLSCCHNANVTHTVAPEIPRQAGLISDRIPAWELQVSTLLPFSDL